MKDEGEIRILLHEITNLIASISINFTSKIRMRLIEHLLLRNL